jgi:spermidine/putrescine-binding protein
LDVEFISSKKLADFETHDLLLDELRKSKLRYIKDIRNAFKHENKCKLKDQRQGYIAELLRYHEASAAIARYSIYSSILYFLLFCI